jgi:TonB-dependent starch-binding outer membrane protein SusC
MGNKTQISLRLLFNLFLTFLTFSNSMKQKLLQWSRNTLVLFLVCVHLVAVAQDRRVTGRITDASGAGIPGVSVLLKGSSTGTVTDADGNYAINARGNSAALVISAIGFKSQEVRLGTQSAINLSLDEDVSALSEVVVTGYTVDKRRETTGAVSLVKSKDLVAMPSGNVEQQLQGRVAGLTVITNGQPGTSSQVRVRGFGAFGGNQPLYVVDGFPVDNTDFLNPDDIETTTVLKDAAAASIYGARAANGVIVYTTKKGTKGAKKLSISYDGMYGVTTPGSGQPMLAPTEFAQWTNQAYINSNQTYSHPQFGQLGPGKTATLPDYISVGGTPGVVGNVDLAAAQKLYNVNPAAGSIYQVMKANKAGTDWYDAITQNAPVQRHTLGFNGGGERSRFYLGLGIQDQKGIVIYNKFQRYSFRINSEFDLGKKLRFGQNLQGTYRQVLAQQGDFGGIGVADDENDILQAFRMPSIIPVYDEFGGYAGTAAKGFNNPRSPVANRNGQKDNRGFNVLGMGNFYLEYDLIPGLTLRSSLGGGGSNNYGVGYTRLQYENSENNSAFGYNEFSGYGVAWTLTNTANYKKTFGKHTIDLLGGQEALNTGKGRNMNASGLSPFSTDIDYITLSTLGSRNPPNSGFFKGVNFYSMFGRAVYTFADKYILNGVVRRDGSSRFGSNNRYGVFPAFSAAWRISAEPFMKELSWVQDLKIRGGWGTMGNSNGVDPNNQYSLFGTNVTQAGYDINGSNSSIAEGFYRTRIGNPDAKWETSVTKNIGFDGTFLGGKLDVILDLWQKDTKDLIVRVPITGLNGPSATAPDVNIGEMENKGIDLQIITRGKFTTDLGYELNLTGSVLDNKIVKIDGKQTYLSTVNPGYRGLFPIRNQLNRSISSFFGYKVLGLYQSDEDVKNSPTQSGAGKGRFKYEDFNKDGKIDDSDRQYLGSPVAKFTGGANFRIMFKNFDAETYIYTSLGNKIFNASKWFTDFYPSFAGAAISERVKESWSESNKGATIPIFETASNFSTNTQANSFYIEDGSYVRLQNVSLGYNLNSNLLSKLKIARLRLYGSVNNLLTLTKYQGLDPGVGGNADTNFGIDVGNYPITRQFTFGVNLGL